MLLKQLDVSHRMWHIAKVSFEQWLHTPKLIVKFEPPSEIPIHKSFSVLHLYFVKRETEDPKVHVWLNGGAFCDSKEACLDRCDSNHDGVRPMETPKLPKNICLRRWTLDSHVFNNIFHLCKNICHLCTNIFHCSKNICHLYTSICLRRWTVTCAQLTIDPRFIQTTASSPQSPKTPCMTIGANIMIDDFDAGENDDKAREGAVLHKRHVGREERPIWGDQWLLLPRQDCLQVPHQST